MTTQNAFDFPCDLCYNMDAGESIGKRRFLYGKNPRVDGLIL